MAKSASKYLTEPSSGAGTPVGGGEGGQRGRGRRAGGGDGCDEGEHAHRRAGRGASKPGRAAAPA